MISQCFRRSSSRAFTRRVRLQKIIVTIGMAAVLAPLTMASPASAATSSVTAVQSVQSIKPQPVAPPSSPKLTEPLQKSSAQRLSISSEALTAAWSVSLSASATELWPTNYVSLTATSNFNVGPTPYYLRIYDTTSGTYVATCGTGTTCSASITFPTATTHTYRALVANWSTTYPPPGQQAISAPVSVRWKGISVSLSSSPTTTYVNGTSTVSATTSADVGPSPFYTHIFDATTGVRVGVCGSGTVCNASVSQSYATTHRYVAYVGRYSTTLPINSLQATSRSAFVTWTWTSYRISLSAPSLTLGSATATATVNQNVGPTPYWIQIFNQNGTRLAVCGSGTTCSATFTPSFGGTNLVAFVSSYSTSYLPPNIQASSNVTTTSRLGIIGPVITF